VEQEKDNPGAARIEVPATLRWWFAVHAVVDVAFALPLLFATEELLPRLGWTAVDPVSPRLVAAALLGIGVQSWRTRNADVAIFREMLALKLVWSSSAILGLALAIARGAPSAAFAFLSIFLVFCGVWSHHAIRFRQLARAPQYVPDDPTEDTDGDGEPTAE
jgi:hypothetical protein